MSTALQDSSLFESFYSQSPFSEGLRTCQDFLSPCSIGSACTNDRTLGTLLCSTCLFVSPTRQCAIWEQGFVSDHRPSQKPVSLFGRTHIGKKERNEVTWNEMKWNGPPWQMNPRSLLVIRLWYSFCISIACILGAEGEVLCLNIRTDANDLFFKKLKHSVCHST